MSTHIKKEIHLQTALGSVPARGIKRKAEHDVQGNVGTAKKLKPDNSEAAEYLSSPLGLVWDHQNWSCAYDSCFTILYYIWTTNLHKWNRIFKDLNPTAALFANFFQKVYNETCTGEHARDLVRAHLHDGSQQRFPYGHKGTVLLEVISEMRKATHDAQSWTKCLECDVPILSISHVLKPQVYVGGPR